MVSKINWTKTYFIFFPILKGKRMQASKTSLQHRKSTAVPLLNQNSGVAIWLLAGGKISHAEISGFQ